MEIDYAAEIQKLPEDLKAEVRNEITSNSKGTEYEHDSEMLEAFTEQELRNFVPKDAPRTLARRVRRRIERPPAAPCVEPPHSRFRLAVRYFKLDWHDFQMSPDRQTLTVRPVTGTTWALGKWKERVGGVDCSIVEDKFTFVLSSEDDDSCLQGTWFVDFAVITVPQ